MKPSLTTDLLRLSKAKPRKKKIMAMRIGGKVKTSRVLKQVKFSETYMVMMLVRL
jgi:3-dehydroquinate dehydratase